MVNSPFSEVDGSTAFKRRCRFDQRKNPYGFPIPTTPLEERLRSSNRKNRKARESTRPLLTKIAAQLGEKIKQFAQSIKGDSEDAEQRQIQGVELVGGSDSHQAPEIPQEPLADSNRNQSSNLGIGQNLSSQQWHTDRHQRQGQQQRNPSRPNREEVKKVEPALPPKPQSKPQPVPLPCPLGQDEVMKITRTPSEAVERYGKGLSDEKTFNNPHYQIQKRAVFETYGWRHYLTVTASDSRGRILVLKGQNSNPYNMQVLENRLARQDVKTFGEIQTALDYLQQVRQLKQDAETLLRTYGTKDLQQPFKGYGTLEGQKYQIVSDSEAFRIMAKDGRGEILNYSNDPYARYPEAKAKDNFTTEDVDLFRAIANQIEQQRREAERQWQRQKEQER